MVQLSPRLVQSLMPMATQLVTETVHSATERLPPRLPTPSLFNPVSTALVSRCTPRASPLPPASLLVSAAALQRPLSTQSLLEAMRVSPSTFAPPLQSLVLLPALPSFSKRCLPCAQRPLTQNYPQWPIVVAPFPQLHSIGLFFSCLDYSRKHALVSVMHVGLQLGVHQA